MPWIRVILLSCVALWGILQSAGSVEAGLRAGAARRSIVPPFPTQMGGFFDRTTNFEGVHDELFARALVLDNGTTRLALIGSDLIAMDADLVQQVRDAVTDATGIPGVNLLICCTHNHSGPSYFPSSQKIRNEPEGTEASLKAFLIKQFVEVVMAPKIDDAALKVFAAKANVRVLEIPTPNWTVHDAKVFGTVPPSAAPTDRRSSL